MSSKLVAIQRVNNLQVQEYRKNFKDFDTEEYILPMHPKKTYPEFKGWTDARGKDVRPKVVSYERLCEIVFKNREKNYQSLRGTCSEPLPRYINRTYDRIEEGLAQIRSGNSIYLCIGYHAFRRFIESRNLTKKNYNSFCYSYNSKAKIGCFLPPSPEDCYGQLWEGWDTVASPELGRRVATYEEFKRAAKDNDFDAASYKGLIKKTNFSFSMPDNPETFYDEWEGWEKILGVSLMVTFEEFRNFVRETGLKANVFQREGKRIREEYAKQHPGKVLPSNPGKHYPEYTNWRNFLGDDYYEKPTSKAFPDYLTFVEIIRSNQIDAGQEYRQFRNRYEGEFDLPSEPYVIYKGKLTAWPFTSNGEFQIKGKLGINETKKICRENNITSIGEYRRFRKNHPHVNLVTDEVLRKLDGYLSRCNVFGIPYPTVKEVLDAVVNVAALSGNNFESLQALTEDEYKAISQYDDGLVDDPLSHYGLDDWDAFVRFKFYSLGEVREYCKYNQISSKNEYDQHLKSNPYLRPLDYYAKQTDDYTKSILVDKEYFRTYCDQRYSDWIELAAEWIQHQTSQSHSRQLIRGFIQRVLVENGLESKVGVYFHKDSEHGSLKPLFNDLSGHLKKPHSLTVINSYLDYCLEITCGDRDPDTNELIVLEGYFNPFANADLENLNEQSYKHSESVKPILPYNTIVDVHELLLPEGAKCFSDLTKAHEMFQSDWYYVDESVIDKNDPDCVWRKAHQLFKKSEYQMWFPGTLIANAVLFFTPHRGRQIVYCDSGEGDPFKIVSNDVGGKAIYEWVENDNPLACAISGNKKRPAQGMLLKLSDAIPLKQQIFDQELAWKKVHGTLDGFAIDPVKLSDNINTIGCYTTTNKTGALSKGGHSTAYIPEALVPWLLKLRDWQTKYNPIDRLTAWTGLKNLGTKKAVLRSRHDQAFLFRNATSKPDNHVPISTQKAFNYLPLILSKVQKDEMPLVVRNPEVKNPNSSNAWNSKYTPHCLRVSLISAYILDGGIAAHIIQKMVGHHSLLMTLYYTKVSQGDLRQQFTEAEERMLSKAPERLKKIIYETNIESLKSEFTSLVPGVLNSIKNSYPIASYGFMDIGICMQSCTGCSEGGELAPNGGDRLQLPKGYRDKNCPACRFFFTGPAFISGLQALQNEILIASEDVSERMERFLLKKQEIEAEIFLHRTTMPNISIPMDLTLELNKFQMAYQQEIETLDVYASDLTRLQLLVRKSIAILNENKSADGFQLLAVGDAYEVENVIEDCSNIRLYYEGVKNGLIYTSSNPKEAVVKATEMISNIANRNGMIPKFYTLSQEQKLVAAKQFMELLLKACDASWVRVEHIANGDLLLSDLGDVERVQIFRNGLQRVLNGPKQKAIYSDEGEMNESNRQCIAGPNNRLL